MKLILDISRRRKRWTINECLQLQREYELLNMTIDEIADKHKRTPSSIMNKLDKEGLADFNMLYSNYYGLNEYMSSKKNIDELLFEGN